MSHPIASLSLDLDNKWSYMKTHGDPGWESFPSYLDVVVPRFLDFLKQRDLSITVFVVGQDAALEKNHQALASIADAGHEIGNHSFRHEPWLHLFSEEDLEADLSAAEEHLERVTGTRPVGFRGPGFSLSPTTLEILERRGYLYDASTFPSMLGPLARAYYFLTARLSKQQKEQRNLLFGSWREGFKPLRPYWWSLGDGRLLEMPVTTMPIFKIPIHVSYLVYLGKFSPLLARAYFRTALQLCQLMGVAPSILLHPLDFLGCDDTPDLAFFPAMDQTSDRKIALVGDVIDDLAKRFTIVTMEQHAQEASRMDYSLNVRGTAEHERQLATH